MQKLDINITKAELTGYDIRFCEDQRIKVTAHLKLMTDEGREITTHQISTDSWREEDKFELPLKCYKPIAAMGAELERVVTKHCQDPLLALGSDL